MKTSKTLSRSVISPGGYSSLHQKYACIGVNKMGIAIIIINSIAGPFYWWITKEDAVLYGCGVEIACITTVIALNYFRLFIPASLMFFLILNFATFYFAAILGPHVNAQLMILYLIGLSIFLFEDPKAKLAGIFIALLNLFGVEYIYSQNLVPTLNIDEKTQTMMRLTAYFVIAFLVTILFYYYARICEKNNKQLENDKSLLLKNNKELEQKVEFALTDSSKSRLLMKEAVHEIGNIFYGVNAVANQMRHMVQENDPDISFDRIVRDLKGGCENVFRMVKNYLALAKLQNGERKLQTNKVDIRREISNLVDEFQYYAITGNTMINLYIDDRVPTTIRTDVVKLKQIIINLVHNAIKHVKAGKQVHVKVDLEGFDQWLISVANEGKYLSDEQLKIMFISPENENLSEGSESNGVGMYVTKQLVDILQGDIKVRQDQKKFTVFEVVFPLNLQFPVHKTIEENT